MRARRWIGSDYKFKRMKQRQNAAKDKEKFYGGRHVGKDRRLVREGG